MRPLIALIAALGLVACAHMPGGQRRAEVDAERLMADVTALAADSMQGRGFGEAGGLMARDYVVAGFEAVEADPSNPKFLRTVRGEG